MLENLGFPQKKPLSKRTTVHALPGQKDLRVEVLVLNLSNSESILCMTLWRIKILMPVNSVDIVADLLMKPWTKAPVLSLQKWLSGS